VLSGEVGDSLQVNSIHLLCKLQTRQALVEVGGQRIAANNGQRFRVSAETVFEEKRQLRFAEWNVTVSILEALNHVRENAQGLVDIFRLFQESSLKVHDNEKKR